MGVTEDSKVDSSNRRAKAKLEGRIKGRKRERKCGRNVSRVRVQTRSRWWCGARGSDGILGSGGSMNDVGLAIRTPGKGRGGEGEGREGGVGEDACVSGRASYFLREVRGGGVSGRCDCPWEVGNWLTWRRWYKGE